MDASVQQQVNALTRKVVIAALAMFVPIAWGIDEIVVGPHRWPVVIACVAFVLYSCYLAMVFSDERSAIQGFLTNDRPIRRKTQEMWFTFAMTGIVVIIEIIGFVNGYIGFAVFCVFVTFCGASRTVWLVIRIGRMKREEAHLTSRLYRANPSVHADFASKRREYGQHNV